MGSAIAERLLNAHVTVRVWDRRSQPAMALVRHGASAYYDPREAVEGEPSCRHSSRRLKRPRA
jgi:3-hydroxyisobutyrate dehydrogenase-like beta-hydroxyacid dehydrogenase